MSSKLSQSILSQIEEAMEKAAIYDCRISSADGTAMDDDGTPHTFNAVVRKNSIDVTSDMEITWYLDGNEVPKGDSAYQIQLDPVAMTIGSHVLSFSALQGSILRGTAEVTLTRSKVAVEELPTGDGVKIIMNESAAHVSNGKDGISPTVSLSKSGKTSTLKITDKNGDHTTLIQDGADGADGKDGKDGVQGPRGPRGLKGDAGTSGTGISSVTVKYYQSSSSSTPSQSSSSWSTTLPTPTAGYYLHTQVAIAKTDGTTTYFYLKNRNGSNGTSPTVVNNLTSTSTTSALSANQGRILSERLRTPQTGWYQKILYDTNNLTCVYIRSWGKGPNAVVTGDISFGSSKPNTPGTTYTYNTGFKFQSATVAANVPFGRDGSGMAHVKIQFDGTITVRIVATSTATGGL
ncbi:collagen-like protein [Allobaculum sp. Allo2]|uniref:collagen-like protein n=1 Tax=Allobaculum sp. Allo2 TaxID=2853432 RepID=UPI001F62631C|nr:collagen-like protein [Allobaculum sp. Allo2]UNT92247.1 collagen-like protein [Allobaculum sp. Allo2]